MHTTTQIALSFIAGVIVTTAAFKVSGSKNETVELNDSSLVAEANSSHHSKSSRRSSSSVSSNDARTAGNTVADQFELEVDIKRVSNQAREKLAEYQSSQRPSEDKIQDFRQRIQEATPEDRDQLIAEFREERLNLHEQNENALTAEDREAKDRYEKLAQLESVFRFAQRTSTPESQALVDQLQSKIQLLARDGESLPIGLFNSDWNDISKLRQQLISQYTQHQHNIRLAAQAQETH